MALFANGSEWDDWQHVNCRVCVAGAEDYQNSESFPACPLYDALWDHAATHEPVSDPVATRIGIIDGKISELCEERNLK